MKEGFIKEGQVLYFGRNRDKHAIVLSNGLIKHGEYSGSIHKVGRDIQKAPCNGWLTWYYIEHETGRLEPIDLFRQKIRAKRLLDEITLENHSEE